MFPRKRKCLALVTDLTVLQLQLSLMMFLYILYLVEIKTQLLFTGGQFGLQVPNLERNKTEFITVS